MNTSPLQNHVLDRLGRPLHDLRISVTDRCNLRCTYCMPADKYGEHYQFLPREALLTFEEMVRVARAAVALGARKMRITGGEPLLRKDLPELVHMLKAIPGVDDIALTTNGVLLPSFAAALKAAGLRRVTVSLDSLDEEVFGAMNGRNVHPADVLAGIDAARAAALDPVKINVVVQRGVNDHTLVDLAARFRFSGCNVRFIEFMDVGTLNGWNYRQVLQSSEVVRRIHERFPLEPLSSSYAGEVAERYRYCDGAGEIGVISSVSQPFCGDCTRLRLSSDGALYTCLFAGRGADVKQLLRDGVDDAALTAFMRGLWTARTDRYSEERAAHAVHEPKVEMYHIGG